MQKILFSIVAASFLTACGTTSGMKTASAPQEASTQEENQLDFSMYNTVIVRNFGDGTKKGNLPEFAGRNFADRVEAAIKGSAVFETVSREDVIDKKSIVVSGDITRYKEGNSAMKLIVGFGAGSTYFDSEISFTDFETSKKLGSMEVDKNSWPLGGGLAMAQTVDSFMQGAAEKIAEELVSAKTGQDTEEKE